MTFEKERFGDKFSTRLRIVANQRTAWGLKDYVSTTSSIFGLVRELEAASWIRSVKTKNGLHSCHSSDEPKQSTGNVRSSKLLSTSIEQEPRLVEVVLRLSVKAESLSCQRCRSRGSSSRRDDGIFVRNGPSAHERRLEESPPGSEQVRSLQHRSGVGGGVGWLAGAWASLTFSRRWFIKLVCEQRSLWRSAQNRGRTNTGEHCRLSQLGVHFSSRHSV